LRHLAKDNPYAAERMERKVYDRVSLLEEFPLTGRPSRGGLRELVISGTPYIAVYRVTGHEVVILRFFHHAQNR